MKRVLVTFVSMADPYKNKRDGSMMHIIRNYNTKDIPIEKVCIYYSKEMYQYEKEQQIFSRAIKHFEIENQKIEICDYPKDKTKLREDVYVYGSFYSEIHEILNEIIKEYTEKDEECEILLNISSGTPAMQTDLSLLGITSNLPKKLKIKMIQVTTPLKSSNNRREFEENIEEALNETTENEEKINENRTIVENIVDTRKLILLESIQDAFNKHDYAGVYNNLKNSEDLFKNKEIFEYSKNLYFRYIGNEKKAFEILNNPNIVQEEIYPIMDEEYRVLLEKINIMKVKYSREEINDWLLIAQTVIEDLYKRLVEKILNIKIEDIEKEGKISYDEFKIINANGRFNNIDEIIRRNDSNFINAFILRKIILRQRKIISFKLKNNITVLDKIRENRNRAAHTLAFVDKESLNKDFLNKIRNIEKEHNIKVTDLIDPKLNALEETEKKIKELVVEIIPKEYLDKLDDTYNVYDTITNKILTLIKNEIY